MIWPACALSSGTFRRLRQNKKVRRVELAEAQTGVSKLELWDLALEDLRGAVSAWGGLLKRSSKSFAEQAHPSAKAPPLRSSSARGPELKLRDLLSFEAQLSHELTEAQTGVSKLELWDLALEDLRGATVAWRGLLKRSSKSFA